MTIAQGAARSDQPVPRGQPHRSALPAPPSARRRPRTVSRHPGIEVAPSGRAANPGSSVSAGMEPA